MFAKEETARYAAEDVQAVTATLRSGSLSVVFGRQTMRFEREFARFVGTEHAVATEFRDGRAGHRARPVRRRLRRRGRRARVHLRGAASAVVRDLAVPVFADISPTTWNLTAEAVAAALTDRTRAVIVPHMFGNPVDVESVRAVCAPRGIAVIEDCAQAAGAGIGGRRVGSLGDVGCFSFNEIKNITTGEGGMITMREPERADLARVLRLHGTRNLVGAELGLKSTMTEMEAALGRSQLARLDRENACRAEFGTLLATSLGQLDGLAAQEIPPTGDHVFSRFVFTVDPEVGPGMTRDDLAAGLSARGISTVRPVYGTPLYRQPVFAGLADGSAGRGFARSYLAAYGGASPLARWQEERLPEAERFCRRQVGLIVPPGAGSQHAKRFADEVAAVLERRAR